MASVLAYESRRYVRHIASTRARTPWSSMWRNAGHRKLGPRFDERCRWPGALHEVGHHAYAEILPRHLNINDPDAIDYVRTQAGGYTHPVTKEWVNVDDMNAEIVVPTSFITKLKPYVSFRADAEINERLKKLEDGLKNVVKWSPKKCTPQLLFDIHYKDKVLKAKADGKYGATLEASIFADESSKSVR